MRIAIITFQSGSSKFIQFYEDFRRWYTSGLSIKRFPCDRSILPNDIGCRTRNSIVAWINDVVSRNHLSVLIRKYRKFKTVILNRLLGIALVIRTNSDEFRACSLNLRIVVLQLTELPSTERSPTASVKNKDDVLISGIISKCV